MEIVFVVSCVLSGVFLVCGPIEIRQQRLNWSIYCFGGSICLVCTYMIWEMMKG